MEGEEPDPTRWLSSRKQLLTGRISICTKTSWRSRAGIPEEEEEEEEEEATQDQEPSSTVTIFENLSLNTNANNIWERRGSGRMILERQDAEEDAPRPHNIWGFPITLSPSLLQS